MAITQVFKSALATYLSTVLSTGEVGTGTTAPSETDTGLETPVSGSSQTVTPTVNNSVVSTTYLREPTGATGSITEYGVFDTSSNLVLHVTFPAITLASNDNKRVLIVGKLYFN